MMCGIVGVMFKSPAEQGPVGQMLCGMMEPLFRRGPDSAGIAVYTDAAAASELVLRVLLNAPDLDGAAARAQARAERIAPVTEAVREGALLRLKVQPVGEISALVSAIDADRSEVVVASVGYCSEIVKKVGAPDDLQQFAITAQPATHGIGHTRMATESKVDLAHSQPFGARVSPDIAVVHNGHITNYLKMKRRLEAQGYEFTTHNDSEVIPYYVDSKLRKGASLAECLRDAVRELDGTFNLIVATPRELGVAKDPIASKPLCVVETDRLVAIASEAVALHGVVPAGVRFWEPPTKEVLVWSR